MNTIDSCSSCRGARTYSNTIMSGISETILGGYGGGETIIIDPESSAGGSVPLSTTTTNAPSNTGGFWVDENGNFWEGGFGNFLNGALPFTESILGMTNQNGQVYQGAYPMQTKEDKTALYVGVGLAVLIIIVLLIILIIKK